MKEKETSEGYVLDGEIREIDLTYVDQDTAEVTYSTDWQNKRQKVEVSVLKKEKDSDRVLERAVFALSAKEDITNKDGDVILEAGTVIEEKATGEDGKLTFEANLPIGFSYTVKETSPAPGFATTDEVQEFTFTAESSDKATVFYEFTFEDEPTVFEFTKTSLTTGEEIEGAKLTVTDENGEVVDGRMIEIYLYTSVAPIPCLIFTILSVQFLTFHIKSERITVHAVQIIFLTWDHPAALIKDRFHGGFIILEHEIALSLSIIRIFTGDMFQDGHERQLLSVWKKVPQRGSGDLPPFLKLHVSFQKYLQFPVEYTFAFPENGYRRC